MSSGVPQYRRFRPRNKGYVRCLQVFGDRNRHCFPGPYNSAQSRTAYREFLAEHFPSALAAPPPREDLTFAELLEAYLNAIEVQRVLWHHIMGIAAAVERAKLDGRLVAKIHAGQFGPRALKAVRATMEVGWAEPPKKEGREPRQVRWSRNYINDQIGRLVRIFKWGVGEELVPEAIWATLFVVPMLREGETKAPETEKVGSVPWEIVDASLKNASPTLRAMAELQHINGIRSGNLCAMKPNQIDTSGEIWEYRPWQHKTKWRGKKLVIMLGPRSQAILKPFMDRDPDAYLFSPRESEIWRRARQREARQKVNKRGWKLKVQPSQQNKPTKLKPIRTAGDCYTTESYRRAIQYHIEKTGSPHWFPHMQRHTRADAVKKQFGAESSTAFLGQASIQANELYTEQDLDRARKVAREVG